MWPFTKPVKKADITANELREEFAECKSRVNALEMEWERTYAKLRGIVARMSRKSGEEIDAPPATSSPVETNTLPMTQSQLARGGARFPRRNY
jgi:hypothetical protein